MELFVLGLVAGMAGGMLAGNSKKLVKTAAKGYLAVADKTKELAANIREDFRDAVEEARYEREQEAEIQEELELREETPVDGREAVETKPATRARRKPAAAESEPAETGGTPASA